MTKDIFNMSTEEFEKWLKSKEFKKLANKFVKAMKKEQKTNPFYNAEECCVWRCPYNSGYDHDVQMGEMTLCHKFKWKEENTCDKIEHFFG